MSETERVMGVGLVGHRSFIAQALATELERRLWAVQLIEKSELGTADLSGLRCLYLVLGRDRPTPEEASAELAQVRSYVANPIRCPRTVYLSSCRSMEHKRDAEELLLAADAIVIRPPAVFGPRQRLDSRMLIPSLARSDGSVPLLQPDEPTDFVSADALARELADVIDPWIGGRHVLSIRGSFRMTPTQARDLYLTFRDLIDAWDGRGPGR